MVPNKKMLVSDYDQTFYLNDEDIERNKAAIKRFRQKGNLFVIATGRSFADFNKKRDLYDIEYDYLILNHGSTILDSQGNMLSNHSMPDSILPGLEQDLDLAQSLQFFCCSSLESRVDFAHGNLTKINSKYSDRATAIAMRSRILNNHGNDVNVYLLSSNSIEIISSQTDKSHAVAELLTMLGLPKSNVYTVGDGYADMTMIRDYTGYRMRNCVPELKTVTPRELSSVSELAHQLSRDCKELDER